jgi:FKBP-type peptidyl-prolyl cis-trans isomerase SlyD
MTIKKGDFVELSYTGRIDDAEKAVFDTTDEKTAKNSGIYSPKTAYGNIIVPLGEGYLLPGLDKQLDGLEEGKHTIQIEAKDGFGIKDAKKLQLVPMKFFKRDNVQPVPGLQVNIDDQIGVVRSVSGGRVIIDFNHPLSSKDLIYEVNIVRKVNDVKEQVESIFKIIGIKTAGVTIDGKKAVISLEGELPGEFTKPLSEDIKRLTELEEVVFENTKSKK